MEEIPKDIEGAFVKIKLDTKKSNGLIRIFEVIIQDEAGEEYEFEDYDEGAHFGTTDEIEEERIIKYVKDRLKTSGFKHCDSFDYEVDTEDIMVV